MAQVLSDPQRRLTRDVGGTAHSRQQGRMALRSLASSRLTSTGCRNRMALVDIVDGCRPTNLATARQPWHPVAPGEPELAPIEWHIEVVSHPAHQGSPSQPLHRSKGAPLRGHPPVWTSARRSFAQNPLIQRQPLHPTACERPPHDSDDRPTAGQSCPSTLPTLHQRWHPARCGPPQHAQL